MALIVPEYLQNKKYSARRDRLALQHGGPIQAGVWDSDDLRPVQRSAGANMSVDVKEGYALVAATNSGNKGFYHAENDATVNLPITAAHSTLPRIDQIFLRINDSTDGAGASDTASLEVVTGTATSGATLDNRNGVGSVPANAIRIADVLVGAGVTTITNSNIRDRRPWARGAFSYKVGPSGSDVYMTNSLFTTIHSSLQTRIECTGAIMKATILFYYDINATPNRFAIVPFVNGVHATIATGMIINQHVSTGYSLSAFQEYLWVPPTGSNLIDWRVALLDGSSAQLRIHQGNTVVKLEEVLRPNATNE